MKIEMTEFKIDESHQTRIFTGMDAVGIKRSLYFQPWNPLENHSWGGATVFIARYANGRIYRVWVATA